MGKSHWVLYILVLFAERRSCSAELEQHMALHQVGAIHGADALKPSTKRTSDVGATSSRTSLLHLHFAWQLPRRPTGACTKEGVVSPRVVLRRRTLM